MADITYQYTKERQNFGRQPMFCEFGPEMCDSIGTHAAEHRNYILRNPVHQSVQHGPVFSRHDVNTIRAEYRDSGCNHAEGGWPRDVLVTDPEATQRYRRKVEKDDAYIHCVMTTASGMEEIILQNNAIDMYQTYYTELPALPEVEYTSCRTVNVYRDGVGTPNPPCRPVTSICWRPDGGQNFTVTYLDMDFWRIPRGPIHATIWNTENANAPESTLNPPCPLLDLQYNPRNLEIMAGGLLSGQVASWDLRSRDMAPSIICPPHVAHRDFVRNVRFINAKSGLEFFSAGPDGCIKWWDLRNMSGPTDQMILHMIAYANEEVSLAKASGVSCLEFEPTIPTRFMVGTENGMVISGNRKGKTPNEKLPAKFDAHIGPVWTVERNPNFLKNFLTVGDWTARIWSEDCRESSIVWTHPHRHKITHAAWSPTRMSLMLLMQSNGVIALWDVLRNQHAPVLTMQVCEEPLVSVSPHEQGAIAACGSSKGSVYIVEMSRNLVETSKQDKTLLTAIFERESKRERILEARLREIRLKQRTADEPEAAASAHDMEGAIGDRDLAEATLEYNQIVKKELTYF